MSVVFRTTITVTPTQGDRPGIIADRDATSTASVGGLIASTLAVAHAEPGDIVTVAIEVLDAG